MPKAGLTVRAPVGLRGRDRGKERQCMSCAHKMTLVQSTAQSMAAAAFGPACDSTTTTIFKTLMDRPHSAPHTHTHTMTQNSINGCESLVTHDRHALARHNSSSCPHWARSHCQGRSDTKSMPAAGKAGILAFLGFRKSIQRHPYSLRT
jgi:hypothetical protein